jgi:RimJ/RimL family protein N-acetyltransferase
VELAVDSPFPFEALPRVWRWIETFRERVADDFSPKTEAGFVDFMAARWESMKTWAIRVDGELAGLILFERVNDWLGTAHFLLKPEFHAKGIAVKAARAAVAEMFRAGAGKLEFRVIAPNVAIGSLICAIGGTREATQRSQTLQGGKPVDVWLYGLTKQTWEANDR